MQFRQELQILLRSRYLFINIVTYEEERIEYIVNTLNLDVFKTNVYCWDFIDGFQGSPQLNSLAKRNPMQALELIESHDLYLCNKQIFILRDFYSFLQDISIIRKVRNLSRKLKNVNCNILIISSEIGIPNLLKDVITIIECPLPTVREIEVELIRLISVSQFRLQNYNVVDLAFACKGLSIERIRRLICKVVTLKYTQYDMLQLVFQEKRQFIRQIGSLDCYYSDLGLGLDAIGGLNILKTWLRRRSVSFSKKAINYGLPAPKGVLLTGIQGTGKSLVAKSISCEWNLPLLRLDIGKLFAGVVGQSEEQVRHMIQVAEASAPCVLWIDEIDKAFLGSSNSYADSGTANRVFLTFLNWLSEKQSFVFIVSTANNIIDLPPEILRKGRFDEIFFINLPNSIERRHIFKIHLMHTRPLTWFNYDIDLLSRIAVNFSGSEIRQVIIEAMHNAFYERREFSTLDVVNVIRSFVPLYFTYQSNIAILQQWADCGKIRLASDYSDEFRLD